MIRLAMEDDLDRLVELTRHFLASSVYGALFPFNPVAVEGLILTVLHVGAIFVAEVDGRVEGMLAVAVLRHQVSGELIAEEIAWWVEPGHRHRTLGPRLLGCLEDWAVRQRAIMVKMVSPTGDTDLEAFYRRLGYVAVETAFVKRLHKVS